MHIVAVKFLRIFWEEHSDTEQPLKSWVDEAKKAKWTQPSEIKVAISKREYPQKSPGCVQYQGQRLPMGGICCLPLPSGLCEFISTHHEYDAIDAETIEGEV